MTGIPQVTWEQFALGLGVLFAGSVVAWLVRAALRRLLTWRGRSDSSATVFGGLAQVVTVALAIGAALTITFPSVKPVDVIGGISIISIAAGIAFQTVLGNMFAGMVILGRDRFRVGDQIKVGEHAGNVVELRLSFTAAHLRRAPGADSQLGASQRHDHRADRIRAGPLDRAPSARRLD